MCNKCSIVANQFLSFYQLWPLRTKSFKRKRRYSLFDLNLNTPSPFLCHASLFILKYFEHYRGPRILIGRRLPLVINELVEDFSQLDEPRVIDHSCGGSVVNFVVKQAKIDAD